MMTISSPNTNNSDPKQILPYVHFVRTVYLLQRNHGVLVHLNKSRTLLHTSDGLFHPVME
jgi:hypothetical protein